MWAGDRPRGKPVLPVASARLKRKTGEVGGALIDREQMSGHEAPLFRRVYYAARLRHEAHQRGQRFNPAGYAPTSSVIANRRERSYWPGNQDEWKCLMRQP